MLVNCTLADWIFQYIHVYRKSCNSVRPTAAGRPKPVTFNLDDYVPLGLII